MSTTHKFSPRFTRTLAVASGTVSGAPVIVGSLTGVALTDRDADGEATVGFGGVAELAVATTTTIALGGPVYITSAGAVTAASAGNTLFGYALQAKGSTAGEVIPIELVTP